MLTSEELNKLTEDQRREYFFGELCLILGLQRTEIHDMRGVAGVPPGYVGFDYLDEPDDWYINIFFDDDDYNATYSPMTPDNRFTSHVMDVIIEWWGDEHVQLIQRAIRHTRNTRRVQELEAENRLLRAAHGLPSPITGAILPHMAE